MTTHRIIRALFIGLWLLTSPLSVSNVYGQPSNWIAYDDVVYGFSLSYPDNWQITPASYESGSVTVLSRLRGVPGKIEISVASQDKATNVPLSAWAIPPESLGIRIRSTQPIPSRDIRGAFSQYLETGEGTILRAYIPRNTKVYIIDLIDPYLETEEVFSEILKTWMFTKGFDRQQPQTDNLFTQFIPANNAVLLANSQSVSGNYILPFSGYTRISQAPFSSTDPDCNFTKRTHSGVDSEAIDFPMSVGTPVYASETGYQSYQGNLPSYGNVVLIRHDDGRISWYAHLSSFALTNTNVQVEKGRLIGYSGDIGNSTGPHLHFMIQQAGARQSEWIRNLKGIHWYSGDANNPCQPYPNDDGFAYGPPALFTEINYRGESQLFDGNDADLQDNYIGHDNALSVRLNNGQGNSDWSLILYQDITYRGISQVVGRDIQDLSQERIGARQVSSLKVGYLMCPAGLEETANSKPQSICEPNVPVGQYVAEYYNNPDLSGNPTFSRNENDLIDYQWSEGGPGNGLGNDNFSVRWTGRFNFSPGTYIFTARADDGIRVYIDGSSIIDEWRDQPPTTFQRPITIGGGEHEVRVEYYERGGGAIAQVGWQPSGCPIGQYRANYYNNADLSGSPTFTRCEGSINNDWDASGPGNGVSNDNFSVRWTGRFSFNAGNYVFTARTDDGMRVYVDGNLIINAWWPQAPTTHQGSTYLGAGEHEVKVEYNEYYGGATAQVWWDAPMPCSGANEWQGQYWNNQSLSGSPVLCRNDGQLNFDWGGGSPDPVVPGDHFSARWTRDVSFGGGRYRFHLAGDDGLRLWLDNNLIIDKWIYQGRTEYTAEVDLSGGNHNLKVEYFEGGGAANVSLWWEGPINPPGSSIDPNKTYRILAVHSGKGLDVGGASQDNGARVQQWTYAGAANQKWRFESTGDGYYMIRAVHSNKCLDVQGASPSNGAGIHQWACAGANNQRWQVVADGNAFVIRAKHSGKVLDVAGASQDNGTFLIQWDYGGGGNQRWTIEAVP